MSKKRVAGHMAGTFVDDGLIFRNASMKPTDNLPMKSELGAAGGAREGDHVADVGHAREKQQGSLQPQAEPGMRHRAVAAQVQVPPISGRIELLLAHALFKNVQALLALTAADDLAHARNQNVHGPDRLAVVVDAHVKGLERARVIE